MAFLKTGTSEGTGATPAAAAADAFAKAVDRAVEDIELLYVPALQDKFHPGIEDDDAWWDERFMEIVFTIEKAKPGAAPADGGNKATVGWKVTGGPVKNRVVRLPAGKTGTYGPTDPVPGLCKNVFVEQGRLNPSFDKPFAKSLALNEVIGSVKARIKGHLCPDECGDETAILDVEVTEIGSSGDTISLRLRWWLRIYCS